MTADEERDRSPVGEYTGLAAEQSLQHTEPGSSPWGTRDDLRRFALDEQRLHDPAQQPAPDAWPGRCALCHYERHPCDVYDLASAVLWLLDEGRTDA